MKTDLTTRNEQSSARESSAANETPAARPRVDVFENASEYLVVVDIPGVGKDGLDVRFESGELRIEARRSPSATDSSQGQPLAEEYRIADYRRAGSLRRRLRQVHLEDARRIDIRAS